MSLKDMSDLLWPGASGNAGNKYYMARLVTNTKPKTIATEPLNYLETIIAHKPGDPGPAYDVIERAKRVVETLDTKARLWDEQWGKR